MSIVAKGGEGELWASTVLMFIIVLVQTFGWQANKFLDSPETAPLEYRHIGGAVFASGEWSISFITVMSGPIELAKCERFSRFSFSLVTQLAFFPSICFVLKLQVRC